MGRNGLFSLIDFISEAGPLTGTNRRKIQSFMTKVYDSNEVDVKPEPLPGMDAVKEIYFQKLSDIGAESPEINLPLKITFVVNHDGTQSDFDFPGIPESKLKTRLLENLRLSDIRWNPGIANNGTVRVRMTLEIN